MRRSSRGGRDDLYGMKEYEQARAAATAHRGIPRNRCDIVRDAWLVVGHSSYELARYSEPRARI